MHTLTLDARGGLDAGFHPLPDQAEYAPSSPVSPSLPWTFGDESCKNYNIFPLLRKNEGECCISCNNLGAIGFKSRRIARNFALYATLTSQYRFIPPFCCIKRNIRSHA